MPLENINYRFQYPKLGQIVTDCDMTAVQNKSDLVSVTHIVCDPFCGNWTHWLYLLFSASVYPPIFFRMYTTYIRLNTKIYRVSSKAVGELQIYYTRDQAIKFRTS